jgi:DNA-binding response OmpR family regulator
MQRRPNANGFRTRDTSPRMKKRILIVEDDAALARVLADSLAFEGFDVTAVREGRAALERARDHAPDLILLDIGLPDTDGFTLVGLFRQAGPTPIIVLTARSQKADKLHGLTLGADDYVTKPFDMEELFARIHAVMRRSRFALSRLSLGEVTIDFEARTADRHGTALHLTDREFEILRYLAEHQARIVYRDELLKAVWGYPDAPLTRSVDHAIGRLRKKIESDARRPQFIQTVHGDGYRLVAQTRPG